jgi:ATP-dependent helicase/nuclease subunit B
MGDKDLLPVEVAQAIERGAAVVTGNQRTARTLRRALDQRNRELGLVSWRPAPVMAWEAWTAGLWHRLLINGEATHLLLNRTQEHAVWREILEQDSELASLRSKDSLAEMAARAWRLLCSYQGQRRLGTTWDGTDARAFQLWVREFVRRCRVDGLLSQAQLEETLRRTLETGRMVAGVEDILLVGFDRMTPSQTALVEAVKAIGWRVEELQPAVEMKSRLLVEATDEREELETAARWLRQFAGEHPNARVAVIVPELEEQRAEIDRVFREVMAPELQRIEASSEAAPYEFSLGIMLAETSMAAVALELLRWVTEALPLERVSGLLLSPYFGTAEDEMLARAEFDAFELRKEKMLRPEISLDWMVAVVEGSRRRTRLGRLLARLRAMQRTVAARLRGTERRSHAEWAERMRELLDAAGWGAGTGESSVEVQTRDKWESALDELSTLDFNGARVAFVQAFDALERIARQTVFAPESREAPVQVMGPLEAAGGSFDAIWFLRGGEMNWPKSMGTAPLLPWGLQRDLGMPGTDVTHDTTEARQVAERIASSAGMAVFSYARHSSEGRQRHSPVLDGLGLVECAAEEIAGTQEERAVVELERVEDNEQLPILPDQVIHGGAEILRLQAACGFRAFAQRRLWSSEIPEVPMGMDAAERGTVVHRVLELFWDATQTQSALQAMTQAEREELLDRCIEDALGKEIELSATPWDAAYIDMQHERLHTLLRPWLELELERPPFAVKLSEKNFDDVRIGPLRLNVRVDRVDVGEQGDIIIDYKTGEAKPADWLTDRPDAPQLPLYAVLSEAPQLEAVAFGLVRAGEDMGLHGFATNKTTLRKTDTLPVESLKKQVEEWRRVLVSLATDFYNGDVRVRPKQFPVTCAYCSQRLLCRLDASALEEDDATTEEGRG